MSSVQDLPSAFDSLAGINKYVAVQKVSPIFYKKHWRAIEFAATFVRHFVSSYPALEQAFRTALSASLREGSHLLQSAMSTVQFSEEDLQWFDRQMSESLKVLIPVVCDAELPDWLKDTR